MTLAVASTRHEREVVHDDHLDRRTVARERRAARTAHGLTQLLDERPELGSACPWAAFAVDALRWSV